ncbi:hypothetical protein AYX15_06244 [Cryptococcus neoformans]|nr:hypothetical protein AYX15_06244 [Cryptococcus neoformans var. grubii]
MSSSYPSHHHHHVSRAVEHPHPLSPAFPSRTQHQLHTDTDRAQPTSTYGSSAQRRTSVTEEGPLETDPMLPSLLASHIHSPILVPSTDLVVTMTQLDQGVEVNQADQTIEAPAPPPPPPPLKDPSPPPPLSKRLFNAIVHKPTLSRTWEKKSFVDEQKSAPAIIGGDESLERGNDLDGLTSSPSFARSRPVSLYASPAEIAAFKPLPLMMDERNVQGDTQMTQVGMLAVAPKDMGSVRT